MWNAIFLEMGLNYVENESIWEHFKKLIYRVFLIMFWSPVILVMKIAKRLGAKFPIEK